MKSLPILLTIFCFSIVSAQNSKPEREPFTLKVQWNAKQFYAQQIAKSPYFAEEKTLQIYPDEKVNLEAEIVDGAIVSLTSVKENLHPEKTFEIEFCQTIENHVTKSDELWIKNPFGKKLKYQSLYYIIDSGEWKQESHSIAPKTTTSEIPKEILGSIVLRDWKFED